MATAERAPRKGKGRAARLYGPPANAFFVPFEATTYPHAIVFQTPIGEFRCLFQDQHTVSFGLPSGVPSGIGFTVVPDLARPDARGGEFKTVRNCAYSTNAELVLNQVEHSGSGYDVILAAQGDLDAAIILHIQGGMELQRAVTPFRVALAAAEERWHRWFAAVPSVDEPWRGQYYYAWWVLGNNILSPYGLFRRESVSPSSSRSADSLVRCSSFRRSTTSRNRWFTLRRAILTR